MRTILCAALAAVLLGGTAYAQAFGGSSDSISNGPDDTGTVTDDTTDFAAPGDATDSDQPADQTSSGELTGQTGLDTDEAVPGTGMSGGESGSSLPDLGQPSPSTPSDAESPDNAGPTLPELAPGEMSPAPSPAAPSPATP